MLSSTSTNDLTARNLRPFALTTNLAMVASAITPAAVACKTSLHTSPRQTPVAVRLPARRINRSVVAAAHQPSKVRRRAQTFRSRACNRLKHSEVFHLLAGLSDSNSLLFILQAQVASAATALTAFTLAVAPAAQAAQEAFIVADVSTLSFQPVVLRNRHHTRLYIPFPVQ